MTPSEAAAVATSHIADPAKRAAMRGAIETAGELADLAERKAALHRELVAALQQHAKRQT